MVEPESLLEAEDPLEIVHQAPEEIAAHRRAIGDRALELHEIVAQEHDAVEVIDLAVMGDLVVRRGAVLADIDAVDVPYLGRQPRYPIGRLRPDPQPFRLHVREGSGE